MRAHRAATILTATIVSIGIGCAPFDGVSGPAPEPSDTPDAAADVTPDAGAASAGIVLHGTSHVSFGLPPEAKALILPAVERAEDGDVLVAAIAVGDNSTSFPAPPTLTPPPGWTELRRVVHGTAMIAILYVRTNDGARTPAVWVSDRGVTGVAWMTAYGGVETSDPVAAFDHRLVPTKTSSAATPVLTTFVPSSTLLVGLFGKAPGASATPRWNVSAPFVERLLLDNGGTRSAAVADLHVPDAGTIGEVTFASSAELDYAIVFALALRPR